MMMMITGICSLRLFFLIPNFTDTGSKTFFLYQFFPIPVPIPPEKWKIPGTDTNTVPVPIMNLLNSKILATKIISGTKFFRYRFRDFFRYQFVPIPVPIPPKKLKIPGTSTSHFVIYTLRAHPGHSQRIFREHSLHVWSAAMSQDVLSLFFPKISNIAIFGIFCATKETVRGSKLMGCSFLAPTHPPTHICHFN